MSLIVETTKGKIEGFQKDGMDIWLGIPHSKPPVGDLRFKHAQPMDVWDGVKECRQFGNKPIQFPFMQFGKPIETVPESEDCLYLNIWKPADGKKLPVFVWIYGGANHIGEGSDPSYDGEYMAKQGILFVNYNYRVGPLGFYDFSIYDDSFDANCGVSDQLAGLKWIKENIEAFGGDPDNITIAGESAGGTAVYDMLACPAAKGLFRKAIAQSGLSGSCGTKNAQKLNLELFLDQMHLSTQEVAKLKEMPADEMKAAATWLVLNNCAVYPSLYCLGPEIGDDLLPQYPWDAMASGSAAGVDVIFGSNHDEGTLFVQKKNTMFPNSWAQTETMLRLNAKEAFLPRLKQLYGNLPNEREAMCAIARDRAFWADHIRCADAQSTHGNVWVYRYDFSAGLLKLLKFGAMHGSEIPFALGNMTGGISILHKLTGRKKLKNMTAQLNTAWVNFAKYGDPNGSGIEWESYDAHKRATHIFSLNPITEYNPNAEALALWNEIGQLYAEPISEI